MRLLLQWVIVDPVHKYQCIRKRLHLSRSKHKSPPQPVLPLGSLGHYSFPRSVHKIKRLNHLLRDSRSLRSTTSLPPSDPHIKEVIPTRRPSRSPLNSLPFHHTLALCQHCARQSHSHHNLNDEPPVRTWTAVHLESMAFLPTAKCQAISLRNLSHRPRSSCPNHSIKCPNVLRHHLGTPSSWMTCL